MIEGIVQGLLNALEDYRSLETFKLDTYSKGLSSWDEITHIRGVIKGLRKAVEIVDSSR